MAAARRPTVSNSSTRDQHPVEFFLYDLKGPTEYGALSHGPVWRCSALSNSWQVRYFVVNLCARPEHLNTSRVPSRFLRHCNGIHDVGGLPNAEMLWSPLQRLLLRDLRSLRFLLQYFGLAASCVASPSKRSLPSPELHATERREPNWTLDGNKARQT